MNYFSIQTLLSVFQGSISLLPLLMVAWKELEINEKLQLMRVNKHHGVPFHESVCHLSYLPFLNGKSMNQLSGNIPYHQRVFNTIWDKANAIKWWQLIEAVSDDLLFHQVKFPNMAKDGVMIIDDTAIEKFGIQMENASEVRISGGKINIGYVAFLACVYLPSITIPIACKTWVPATVEGYESKVSMAIASVKHFARQAKKTKFSISGMVVVFDTWYFAVELCKEISINRMIWITQSKSNRKFYLADDKGNPAIKKRASDFMSFPIGQMKPLYRKSVKYHNIGRCYLPRYGWVYVTVVYDTRRNPESFLLVTNNLQANGPWIIESYYKRWGIETLIRDAKQSLGLPNFHMRDFNGITAHLCVCILNYLVLSWLRYSRNLNMTIGQMVHTVFHELILKAVEEVHQYSLSQEIDIRKWLPIAA
jgi:Transposase DDE domain